MIRIYHIKTERKAEQSALLHLSFGPSERLKSVVTLSWSSDAYEEVARVETDDLELAYKLTNNISGSWSREPQSIVKVTRPLHVIGGLTYGLKSSCVGDVMVLDNEKLYFVDTFGFTQFESQLPEKE